MNSHSNPKAGPVDEVPAMAEPVAAMMGGIGNAAQAQNVPAG